MTAIALRQFTDTSSGGASETAGFIAGQIDKSHQQLQGSYILGQLAKGSFDELFQVFDECRHANWDGYNAVPVSARTFQLTHEFLEALPLGMSAPAVGAEPDGHLTLEWYRSPRRMLSVSISPEGDLHYAALIGPSKYYGTEPFFGEVTQTIVDMISRISVT